MLATLLCKQLFIHFLKHNKFLINQKKKMLKEELYNPSLDFPLFIEKISCKKLCYQYNNLSPENLRDRYKIINKILGKVGNSFLIEQPFLCDYGYNIEIGDNFCSNHNLLILDPGKVIFGNNVLVGPNCSFYAIEHPTNPNDRKVGLQLPKSITIENNVWICGDVTVLGGVTIGENSIIGARSVVNKDIPPNSIAVGNPCKVIKTITTK